MKIYEVRVSDSGDICWYLDGKFHREDGPAVEYANGNKFWYLNNKAYTEEEFKAEMARRNNPVVEMTVEQVCKALGKNVKIVKEG